MLAFIAWCLCVRVRIPNIHALEHIITCKHDHSFKHIPLQLPAAAREEAELICSNVQLEMALIDDLLDWTRVMKNKLQLREKIGRQCYHIRTCAVAYELHEISS